MGIFNWLFGGKKYSKEFIKENTHRLYDDEQKIYLEGLMINGKKEGLWKIFDENNNLIIERKYRWNILRSEKIIEDNFLKEKDDADPIDPAHNIDYQKVLDGVDRGTQIMKNYLRQKDKLDGKVKDNNLDKSSKINILNNGGVRDEAKINSIIKNITKLKTADDAFGVYQSVLEHLSVNTNKDNAIAWLKLNEIINFLSTTVEKKNITHHIIYK